MYSINKYGKNSRVVYGYDAETENALKEMGFKPFNCGRDKVSGEHNIQTEKFMGYLIQGKENVPKWDKWTRAQTETHMPTRETVEKNDFNVQTDLGKVDRGDFFRMFANQYLKTKKRKIVRDLISNENKKRRVTLENEIETVRDDSVDEYNLLSDRFNTLNTKHIALKKKYSKLFHDYNDLVNDYNDLIDE